MYVWFVLCYQSSIFISFYFGLSIYQILTQCSSNAAKGKEGVRWEFPRLAEEDEGRQILGTVLHHRLQTGQARTLPIAKQSRNNIGKVLCRQARVCHKLLEKGTYQRCFFWCSSICISHELFEDLVVSLGPGIPSVPLGILPHDFESSHLTSLHSE